MYYKVLVLEIKKEYCLAMTDDGQVLRICKKDGLSEGDRIYVLEEDLYEEDPRKQASRPIISLRPRGPMSAMAAVAAILVICLSIMLIPRMTDDAYAVVSIDGKSSVQVEVDKNYKVLNAISYDRTVPEKELKAFVGRTLDQVERQLAHNEGNPSESLLVAYAMEKQEPSGKDKQMQAYLEELFGDHPALYLKGDCDDVEQAKKQDTSLGIYIAGKALTEDQLEDLAQNLSTGEVLDLLRNHPVLMQNKDFREALEERTEERKERNKDESGSDADEEDDEDKDDDGDNSQPTAKPDKNTSPEKPAKYDSDDSDEEGDDAGDDAEEETAS